MPHSAPKAMGQLRVSFDQIEIEVRRALHIPRAEIFANGVKERSNARRNLYRYPTVNHNKENYATSMRTPPFNKR